MIGSSRLNVSASGERGSVSLVQPLKMCVSRLLRVSLNFGMRRQSCRLRHSTFTMEEGTDFVCRSAWSR
jgi:hypothetical protein